MTIREIEQRTGLDRANIRFYEREGLLAPERMENGYRDYSEDDVRLLLKIKLLRRLGFPLDAIRELKDGASDLDAAIAQRLGGLADERQSLADAERVCREMRDDRAVFSTLDAERYLASFDRAAERDSADVPPSVPASDRVEPPRIPWRRYFARGIDLGLIQLAGYAVLALGFGIDIANMHDLLDLLLGMFCWVILIPIEALLLARFGTTPGKWLWGIRVEHADGRHLTPTEAFDRTCKVFRYGAGFALPIYGAWREYKSYRLVTDGLPTDWDEGCTIVLRDERAWRIAAYIALQAVTLIAVFTMAAQTMLPPNRGELTVDEFVENYNYMNDRFDLHGRTLHPDGSFTLDGTGSVLGDAYTVDLTLLMGDPIELEFEVKDGALVGVSYSRTVTNADFLEEDKAVVRLVYMAFAGAEQGYFGMRNGVSMVEDYFLTMLQGELERDYYDYRITYAITETTQLTDGSARLVEFSMVKAGE